MIQTPTMERRISNLQAIANDPSVNNFARSICAETASYLRELEQSGARLPNFGVGAIVCKAR